MAFRKYSEVHRDKKAAATKFLGIGGSRKLGRRGVAHALARMKQGIGGSGNIFGWSRAGNRGGGIGQMFRNILDPGGFTGGGTTNLGRSFGNLLRRRRNV